MARGHSPARPSQRGRAASKEKCPGSASTSPAPSAVQAPPTPTPTPTLPSPLPGAQVEVRVDDPGFHGSWFEATVLRSAPACGRQDAGLYTVAFSHLAADAGGAARAESVAASHIRPRPPPLPSQSRTSFGLHDVVEAFHRCGWWSGVVFPSPAAAAARSVTVAFPITREVITIPPHYVRPRRDYVGDEWVPSRAAITIQPTHEVRVYEAGDKVEAVKDREPYGRSWFPATVAKVVDRLSYIVEYSDDEDEGDKATEYLHWQFIRPAVDRFWGWEDGMQIAGDSVVEAYCDGAWSPGVVRGMSGEGEYEVIVDGKETEQVVIKVLELLRPRHEWDGSKWSIASPKRQANLRLHSPSGKRPSSPVEVMSSDDERNHDPECSAMKKAKVEPQLLQMVLVQGSDSEHASATRVDSPISGYLTPPDKSMPTVGENPVNQDTLPNMVLPGNKGRKIVLLAAEALEANKNPSDVVSGSSRKVVTDLESLPRKTGSLEACRQHSSLDATVVNDLVEGIIKSRIADSEASFEERNNILSLLKANVEYAQSCHNSLLEVKSVYNKQLEEKGAVEAKKMEKTTSLSQWNSLLDENKKAIAELEQKLEQLRLEGQKIKKEIEHEESELSRLQEVDNSIEKACDDAQRLFRSILAELELKMLNAPSFVNR